ncbi:MAG: UbiA prenyltransferase family protein [Phycisphaerales bacterium]
MPLPATIRLMRPKQWAKSAFVLIGPLYALADPAKKGLDLAAVLTSALLAAVAFSLASSGCYIINDIMDVESDRNHPRKKHRPLASGAVSIKTAWTMVVVLFAVAALATAFVPLPNLWWVLGLVTAYAVNVSAYSVAIKKVVIADVMSLSLGFVLRVLGGCAASGVSPSTWLLNCTLFFAMFLAFGKRLGERRTVADAAAIRAVQGRYTDELLRMATVVTGVALLVTYAGYLESRQEAYTIPLLGFAAGFNLLWLTLIPATFGLLRAIVLLETGAYDDPTELLGKDLPMQCSVGLFGVLTLVPWIVRG